MPDDAKERARRRFITATTGNPPTPEQRAKVTILQEKVIELATLIGHIIPEGRNKELALDALEDAHMRANRAVFYEENPS